MKKYYASIDHDLLFGMLRKIIGEAPVLGLLYQFMKRTVYKGGYYKTVCKGISRGSSLSPLLGALYLEELDEAMKKSGCFYVRYMDDWVILSENKWAFRRLIKKVNSLLGSLKLKKAEDKTFIGKIERGFDFLGFHFSAKGMSLAKVTVRKFAENLVARIYDSKQKKDNQSKGGLSIPDSVSLYIQRFTKWVKLIYEEEKTDVCETMSYQH